MWSGCHLRCTNGNSIFVAVGQSGTILTSSDGTTWTSRTSETTEDLCRWGGKFPPCHHGYGGVTYGNSIFVTVDSSGTILTSSDGTTWTVRITGTWRNLKEVTYGNGLFVTVGNLGIIYTSPEGTSWTTRTTGTPKRLSGVTYSQ